MAILIGLRFFASGCPFYHDGTAGVGWRYHETHLTTANGLLTLADDVPYNTVILIEEADLHEATRQTSDTVHDDAIKAALTKLAKKGCALLLTTVQGEERNIARELVDNTSVHMTPFMDFDQWSLAAIERTGRFLIPNPEISLYDAEEVKMATALANTLKATRHDNHEGNDDRHIANQIFPVRQKTIDDMKKPEHPAYPVYYRYRVVNKIGAHIIHRLTKDPMLNFQWLESVNEHPHETIVLETLAAIAPQWGFKYEPIDTPQDDRFPDGRAIIDGKITNVEIISTQPRYPSGVNLHRLVAMTRPTDVNHIPNPPSGPILVCRTCKTYKTMPESTFEDLPEHEDDHIWILLIPGAVYAPDFPDSIAVTPMLSIEQYHFTEAIQAAVQDKSKKIAEQGTGANNWVIIIAQGFPVIPEWYDALPDEWPENVDGIVVVATEEYMGAYHNWEAQHNPAVILLKCPRTHATAKCYHPSYIRHLEMIDPDLLPLIEDGYTPEQLAQMTLPWEPAPIRKTLTIKDESGNVLGSLFSEAPHCNDESDGGTHV